MDNAALQAFIAEYGSKLVCIVCDNAYHIFLNYENRPFWLEDIEFKTVGGADMFGVSRYEPWMTNDDRYGKMVKVTEWHLTECIQGLVTSDDPEFSPDPNKIK